MEHHHRGEWGSNLGFLMAAVGSAVGLGNIWAFPYKMGASGGFAFLVIYLILAATIGFSIMLCELAIGRRAGRSVLVSYQQAGGKMGTFLGFLAMLSPFLILSFYTVLGAYCMEYMSLNLADLAFGVAAMAGMSGGDTFGSMLTNQFGSVAFTFLFICICLLIIRGGIKDGIEKFNKIGMPALFVMLVIVIVRAVTLPGASEGLAFMFAPNFAPLKENFLKVLSTAGGQMFFSLSLAMGITVTYGSYLSKKESLVKNSLIIIISDTIVAIMAGMAVLPAAFALGGENAEKAGPKLLFITLQDVFNAMGPTGPIFGVLFYLLVILAAITSAIALLEVLATFLSDRIALKGHTPNRAKLVTIVCLVVFAEAALVAADGLGSNGLWIPFHETGRNLGGSWLDFMDFISEGVAMPLGALLMSVWIGWFVGPKLVRDEVELEGHKMGSGLYAFFNFCIKFIVPIAMAFVLYGQVMEFMRIPS
ncbi:sodium-dependent transporter [Colidextribacter sp. OB.20]|uniref:sodium-dependent transporter n=1 Tax=Colidextribacter sp. OB.20 TaxID=2304568 RepID=UPI00136E72F0|nr:sodium-dependent transporter [Colidextribacter sp. OB.20]NBI09368.1 sodium-dependent transporter [Colidextribacter sp. OB.20]